MPESAWSAQMESRVFTYEMSLNNQIWALEAKLNPTWIDRLAFGGQTFYPGRDADLAYLRSLQSRKAVLDAWHANPNEINTAKVLALVQQWESATRL